MFESRSAIRGSDGQILQSDALGVFMLLSVTFMADLWIFRHYRHWDWLMWFVFFFAIIWIPVDFWRENSLPKSKV